MSYANDDSPYLTTAEAACYLRYKSTARGFARQSIAVSLSPPVPARAAVTCSSAPTSTTSPPAALAHVAAPFARPIANQTPEQTMKRYKGISKLDPRKYRVRVRGTNPRTGKRQDLKRICHGSLQDALWMQEQLNEQLAQGGPRARMTLTDYSRSWLRRRLQHLKPSTASKYAGDLTRHILPALGEVYLDALRPRDVAAFVAEQCKQYSGWTVTNQLRLLRCIAKDALADELTSRDFCARVKPPKCRGYDEDRPNLLTAEQLGRVLQAMPERWFALFATLAYTGMRWGEVSGLTWDDIDFARGVVHIRHNNWRGLLGEPKTPASRRNVPMCADLAHVLRKHRQQMIASQHPGLTAGYVFPTQRGTLHKGNPLGAVIRRALAKAGVDVYLTTHGLRRTFNDLARRVAAGQVVMAIVGHTTQAMNGHYSMIDTREKHAVQAAVIELATLPRGITGPISAGSDVIGAT